MTIVNKEKESKYKKNALAFVVINAVFFYITIRGTSISVSYTYSRNHVYFDFFQGKDNLIIFLIIIEHYQFNREQISLELMVQNSNAYFHI